MFRLSLKTPPSALAVEARLVRQHLRVDSGVEDYLIQSYTKAATGFLDGWTGILGRALMPQTWTMTMDGFPADAIEIPLAPVTSVVAVKYKDENGADQTFAPSSYEVALDGVSAVLRAPAGWPGVGDYLDPVEIEFEAGTGCPEPLQVAIMMMVAGMFDGRVGDQMLTPAVESLIAPWRRVRL